MTPTGAVFGGMRTDVLNTFPATSKGIPVGAGGFRAWFETGAYVVKSVSKTEFLIESAADDFAGAALNEVELFTDHCFEQLQEIGCFAFDDRMRSDAWNVVTIYYFSFFSVQVFLRLIGRPVLFLEKALVARFQAIGNSSLNPEAGAYYLSPAYRVGVNRIEFRMKRSKQKIHESGWKAFFQYLEERKTLAALPQTAPEALFYSSLMPRKLFHLYNQNDWPAQIRAKANYRPGFAYGLVASTVTAKTKSLLSGWAGMDPMALSSLVQNSAARCNLSSSGDYHIHVRFLFDLSLTIFQITRQLYGELLERRKVDRRWEARRKRFRAKMNLTFGEYANVVPVI